MNFSKIPFAPDTEGVWLDLPEPVYRKAPGISQSTLKAFDEAASPLHFKTSPPKQPTEDMKFGTLCHTAILEIERFKESFYLRPQTYPVKEKKSDLTIYKPWHGGAEWCKEWVESRKDKPIHTEEEVNRVTGIVKRLETLKPFCNALNQGHREVSFFKRDAETGMLFKCRCDLVVDSPESGLWIFDLKKVQRGGASREAFAKQCADFGYHIQNAFYADITGAAGFVFVAFDDDDPFDAAQWRLVPQFTELGRREYRRMARRFAECVKTDTWPGYPQEVEELEMPRQAFWRERDLNGLEHKDWLKSFNPA